MPLPQEASSHTRGGPQTRRIWAGGGVRAAGKGALSGSHIPVTRGAVASFLLQRPALDAFPCFHELLRGDSHEGQPAPPLLGGLGEASGPRAGRGREQLVSRAGRLSRRGSRVTRESSGPPSPASWRTTTEQGSEGCPVPHKGLRTLRIPLPTLCFLSKKQSEHFPAARPSLADLPESHVPGGTPRPEPGPAPRATV